MRPVRLQLKGFTSFKDGADVSFEALDRFAICGPTGAGKSSLLDALTFALFADAPRKGTGNLANMISLGRKSFSVVLDFAVGERTFRVTRVRRRTGAGSDQLERLVCPNQSEQIASGERPVTEKIEQMLGLNYGHFTQAVFLPQGKFSEFLKAKPADRRRLLNELLRLLVYERMQERAGKDRELQADKKGQAERRLKEDFNGVTAEALTELQRQRNEYAQAVVAADAELPALRANWESVRQARAWTVEWEGKIAERVNHLAHRPGIDTAQAELNAAQRAAGVVAFLDQAESARQDDHRRQDALRHAVRDLGLHRDEQTAAAIELTHATEAASALSALRERLARLNVAEGRLALRDQLARQIAENQGRQREVNGQLETSLATMAGLSTEIDSQAEHERRVLAEMASIGFDPDRFQRLDQMRAAAVRLQSERRQLASLQSQVNGAEAAHHRAESDAETFAHAAAGAEVNAAAARLRWESSTTALRNGESAHAAAHLRATLKPGQDCPVCRRGVETIPAGDSVPELDNLRQEETKTKRELSAAERLASKAAADAAAARATADAARGRAELARAEVLQRQQAVAQQETQVLESVGDLLPDDMTAPIEQRVLDAAGAVSEQQGRHRAARDQLIQVQSCLALARQDLDSHRRQLTQLEEQATAVTRTIAAEEESLGAVREEILAAAGTEEPGIESQRAQLEIICLEGNLTKVTRNEREASERLRKAETLAETCAREAATTSALSLDAESSAVNGLREAGFADVASARNAFRTPQRIQSLHGRITEYEATIRVLDHRIAELESTLGGVRVSSEACALAEAVHEDCVRRRRDADKQVVLLDQQVRNVQERLGRAKLIREELVAHERYFRIYDWLARDLRNDRFQAYLLEETLNGLVTDGSSHLARLTGDRYGLAFEDDRIFVVDHDNAGERRGVDTLSGGETFLASLALALALSNQIQHIAGAVHLDCLFIDEGFGTLDPETLRTVSDAIRGLQVGGRMVGIITHVPELKEEFDQRLIVTNDGATSLVRLEIA